MKIAIKITAWCMCLLCSLSGCSGEDTATKQATNKQEVPVTINLNQAAWGTEQSAQYTKAPSREVSIPVKGGVLTATLEPAAPAQTRSTEINYGVRYRLVAYKENDMSATGYVNHADFVKGGVAPTFWLQTDKTYTLVCYSLNSAETMPEFNKSISTLDISPETDMLYGKKNVTVTTENRSIDMEMQHLFSQVTVIADASADGYTISACSGTLTPNYRATVSLTDGSLTKGSSVSKTINWSSLGYNTVTSNPTLVYTNGETVTATVNSITIDGYVNTNKNFTFTGKTMATGKNYVLRVMFEKYVNDTPVTIGTMKWAPGNLIYSNDTYYFASTAEYYMNAITTSKADLFFWNSLYKSTVPLSYKEVYELKQDPCRKVSPAGTWRTPTYEEMADLRNHSYVWSIKNGVEGMYFGTSTIPAAGTEKNYLFLPATTANSIGRYWTTKLVTTSVVPVPNLEITAGYILEFKNDGCYPIPWDQKTAATVRCIK